MSLSAPRRLCAHKHFFLVQRLNKIKTVLGKSGERIGRNIFVWYRCLYFREAVRSGVMHREIAERVKSRQSLEIINATIRGESRCSGVGGGWRNSRNVYGAVCCYFSTKSELHGLQSNRDFVLQYSFCLLSAAMLRHVCLVYAAWLYYVYTSFITTGGENIPPTIKREYLSYDL